MPFSLARGFPTHHASFETVAAARPLCNVNVVHGGSELRVFGSLIPGTSNPRSDLDLLVAFPTSPNVEHLLVMKLALEDLLQGRVDLVPRLRLSAHH